MAPSGRFCLRKRAKEELLDDRPKRSDADERIRAVIDMSEAVVAHVLHASATEREHELVGGLHRNLHVLDAVEKQQSRCLGIDLIHG
jgi:hypothetical protein